MNIAFNDEHSDHKLKSLLIGLSKKDTIYLFAFKELSQGREHAAVIYHRVKAEFPNKKHSRPYVYDTLKEMEKNNWLSSSLSGRKRIYTLTQKGAVHYQNHYIDIYEKTLTNIKYALDNMLYDITGSGKRQPVIELDSKEREYITKLVRVKPLIQCLTLKKLQDIKYLHGGRLFQWMKDRYGWHNSDGYFYEILRDLDYQDQYIKGEWPDINTRHKKDYHLTDKGREQYPRIAENTAISLRNAKKFVSTYLSLFKTS